MKRKLLTSMLLALVGLITHAQDLDIKPSQQAQGILESKNGMVDHATGLFHYNVPLYEVKSGDFTLPISLNYVAKGVKVSDKSGIIGCNWTLNAGGVVTRTIRGGIADETVDGIAMRPLSTQPTVTEIEEVNKRRRDGEIDIFTASFNGQSVNFIIKKGSDNKLMAISLQRTNVKIEIIQDMTSYGNHILSWIITDDSGNKYTFNQKELTTNLVREGAVGFNGITDRSFISSWYLTKIEPLNSKPIIYKYLEEVKGDSKQMNIKLINQYQHNEVLYRYGSEIIDRPFDFNKYEIKFNECIEYAKSYLIDFSSEPQFNNEMYIFKKGQYIKNEYWEDMEPRYHANFMTMGMLTDFSGITNASNNVIAILNEIIYEYSHMSSQNASMVVFYLRQAKDLMVACLSEVNRIKEKERYESAAQAIHIPLLSRIEYEDKFISFSYDGNENTIKKINEINLLDIYKRKIKGIKINNSLLKISYTDSNNIEYDNIKFEYYDTPYNYISDLWGYPKDADSDVPGIIYYSNVNADYAKSRSLQKISKKNGNTIELDYEENQINRYQFDCSYYNGFGGIRLKSVILKDITTNTVDVIKYSYPEDGTYIYKSCWNEVISRYESISDIITYSQINNTGNPVINFGNNGVYYTSVQEEFVGKGKNKYSFFSPISNIVYDQYPFWLCGIPLNKESYDINNKLTSRVEYSYYDGVTSDEFEFSSDSIKTITQIKPYEFYVQKEMIEYNFKNQKDILIYHDDGRSESINPYDDIYMPNIYPRSIAILPEQTYKLYYGGRAILKGQIVYNFENNNTATTSPNYKKTEYFYDNIYKNLYPTKIIHTSSDGNQNIEVIKRVVDITDNKQLIDTMKSKNIFNVILKTQKQVIRKNNNNCQLIEEKVYNYGCNIIDNNKFIVLNDIYTYNPDVITNITSSNNNLFGYNISKYTVDKISYEFNKGNYLPVHRESINEKTLICYDFANNNTIMKSSALDNNSAMATDNRRFKDSHDYECNGYVYEQFKSFYNKYLQLNFENCSKEFHYYIDSERYKAILKIIDNIAQDKNRISFEDVKLLIDEFITQENVDEFTNLNLKELDNIDGLSIIGYSDFLNISSVMTGTLKYIEKSEYDKFYLFEKGDITTQNDIKITNIESNKNYKLYIISTGEDYSQFNIAYNISHSNGITSKSSTILGSEYPKLSIFDVTLSEYNNISSIDINGSLSDYIYYIALVPEDAEFEAMSYNADGTVFCKFNQNGQAEMYEYDSAMRVTKIRDQNGNVLKEFNYNVVL